MGKQGSELAGVFKTLAITVSKEEQMTDFFVGFLILIFFFFNFNFLRF